jgi:hypothetical protein
MLSPTQATRTGLAATLCVPWRRIAKLAANTTVTNAAANHFNEVFMFPYNYIAIPIRFSQYSKAFKMDKDNIQNTAVYIEGAIVFSKR